jgi:thiol-disulfide isomerase/thioredoxin
MVESSRALIWALVIVFAGAGGYFAYKFADRDRDGLRPDTSQKLVVEDAPAPESEAQEFSVNRPIPETLPEFTLADLRGRPQKLSNWPDRPLLVNFWATWCGPCRSEIPLLIKLRKQHANEGLEIVGIAVDHVEAVRAYAQEIGIDYPVLVGEQEGLDAIGAFGMQPVFPFSVFADRQARIVAIRVGELHEDEAEFILAEVKAIDKGQRTLAEAKQRISDELRNLAVKHANSG